jgi:hypothetical protein
MNKKKLISEFLKLFLRYESNFNFMGFISTYKPFNLKHLQTPELAISAENAF